MTSKYQKSFTKDVRLVYSAPIEEAALIALNKKEEFRTVDLSPLSTILNKD